MERNFCASLILISIVSAGFIALSGIAAEETNMIAKPLTEIPIDLSHNRVMLPATINGSKSLSFHVDTGYGIDMIHPDLIEPLGLKRAGRLTIVGIAGEEQAGTYSGADYDFRGAKYSPRRVASLPSEGQRWRRRDGILGADFFRRFIVEINAARNVLRLYEPDAFSYRGRGESIPLHFISDTPIIDAAIVVRKGELVRSRFEVDTGCDDALCLGRDFVESNKLMDHAEDSHGEKRGVGGAAKVQHGTLPQLQIGRYQLDKPSANFFSEGSPAREGLAGHIGFGALRNWKIIFDYSRQRMILEENPAEKHK